MNSGGREATRRDMYPGRGGSRVTSHPAKYEGMKLLAAQGEVVLFLFYWKQEERGFPGSQMVPHHLSGRE